MQKGRYELHLSRDEVKLYRDRVYVEKYETDNSQSIDIRIFFKDLSLHMITLKDPASIEQFDHYIHILRDNNQTTGLEESQQFLQEVIDQIKRKNGMGGGLPDE